MKAKIVDEEARQRLIVWMRRRMAEFGITPDALEASIQHDLDNPPLYRDARENEWNGLGEMPDWLRTAKSAGVDPEFFRIEQTAKPQAAKNSEDIDARQLDLFE